MCLGGVSGCVLLRWEGPLQRPASIPSPVNGTLPRPGSSTARSPVQLAVFGVSRWKVAEPENGAGGDTIASVSGSVRFGARNKVVVSAPKAIVEPTRVITSPADRSVVDAWKVAG